MSDDIRRNLTGLQGSFTDQARKTAALEESQKRLQQEVAELRQRAATPPPTAEITALRAEVTQLRQQLSTPAAEIAPLRAELAELRLKLEGATAGAVAPELIALRGEITRLTADRDRLAAQLSRVSETTRQPSPVQFAGLFRDAAAQLQTGLGTAPGGARFAVDSLDVEARTMLALGPDGGLRLVLPAPGEVVEGAALSALRFTLRPVAAETAEAGVLLPVPTLLGLSREAALTALTRAGLKAGQVTSQESRSPPGTVVGQVPEPGVEIAPDIPVDMTVAVPVTVVVPDVVGLAPADAEARLLAVGLSVGETRGEGPVRRQTPAAGTRAPLGSAVALELAPPDIRVPDLAGVTTAEAERRLAASGLVLVRRVEVPGPRPGLVVMQDPPAGREVPPGTPVVLSSARAPGVADVIEGTLRALPAPPDGPEPGALKAALAALRLPDIAAFQALAAAPDAKLAEATGIPARNTAMLGLARQAVRAALTELAR